MRQDVFGTHEQIFDGGAHAKQAWIARAVSPGIGRVDFLLEDFLIVEIDGFAFHSKRTDMLRDRRRNNMSTVQGFAVLRYMPEHIWFHPEQVLAEITAVLEAKREVQK